MRDEASGIYKAVTGGLCLLAANAALAGPVYQPSGANLTYGDVTHGQRVQSASSNPAAAAADLARGTGKSTRGTVLSGAAGIEYGNVQNFTQLFEFMLEVGKNTFTLRVAGVGPWETNMSGIQMKERGTIHSI